MFVPFDFVNHFYYRITIVIVKLKKRNLAKAKAKADGIRLRGCLISMNKKSGIDNIYCVKRAGYGAMLNRGFASAKTDGSPNGN